MRPSFTLRRSILKTNNHFCAQRANKFFRNEVFIKKHLTQNLLFTLIIIGVVGYRYYQSKNIENNLKGISLNKLKIYSLEKNQEIQLSETSQQGKKTLYIWATWCPPCRLQNQIIDFYDSIGLKNKNDLLKISVDQDLKVLKKYLGENSNKNHFIDQSNQFFGQQIIKGTPSMITIDKNGFVTDIKMGISFFY